DPIQENLEVNAVHERGHEHARKGHRHHRLTDAQREHGGAADEDDAHREHGRKPQMGDRMSSDAGALDRKTPSEREKRRRHESPDVRDDERNETEGRRLAPIVRAGQMVAEFEQSRESPQDQVPNDAHWELIAAPANEWKDTFLVTRS